MKIFLASVGLASGGKVHTPLELFSGFLFFALSTFFSIMFVKNKWLLFLFITIIGFLFFCQLCTIAIRFLYKELKSGKNLVLDGQKFYTTQLSFETWLEPGQDPEKRIIHNSTN